MEIRVLNYFLMAAREENITKAASLLHLTQPTLSRQLIQLEEELGVKLFRRSKHRIILTEEGMLLRRRAEEIVALAEKTRDDLQHRQEQLAGTISIGSGKIRWSALPFTAAMPTTSRSASSGGFWMWACCRSRWISPDTALSARRSGSSGAF